VRELLRIALFDARKMFDDRGNLVPITDLDDDTAAAIAGLDVERHTEGRGEGKEEYFVMKIKIASKTAALDTLARLHFDATGKMLMPGEAKKGDTLIPAPEVHVHFSEPAQLENGSAVQS
jgi:hypothetical protein